LGNERVAQLGAGSAEAIRLLCEFAEYWSRGATDRFLGVRWPARPGEAIARYLGVDEWAIQFYRDMGLAWFQW
jgi:hypothetical protein